MYQPKDRNDPNSAAILDAIKEDDAGIKYLKGQAADGYRQFRDAVGMLKQSQRDLFLVLQLHLMGDIKLDPKAYEQIHNTVDAVERFLQTGETPNDEEHE